jgi:hypothetical protein
MNGGARFVLGKMQCGRCVHALAHVRTYPFRERATMQLESFLEYCCAGPIRRRGDLRKSRAWCLPLFPSVGRGSARVSYAAYFVIVVGGKIWYLRRLLAARENPCV